MRFSKSQRTQRLSKFEKNKNKRQTATTLQPSDKTTFSHKSRSECWFSPGEPPLGGFYDLMHTYCGNCLIAAVRGACVCRGKHRRDANNQHKVLLWKLGGIARVTWRTGVKPELLGRAVMMSGCSCCRTGRCPRRQVVEESRKRFSKACKEPNNPISGTLERGAPSVHRLRRAAPEANVRKNFFFFLPFRGNKNRQRSSSSCLDLFGINLPGNIPERVKSCGSAGELAGAQQFLLLPV